MPTTDAGVYAAKTNAGVYAAESKLVDTTKAEQDSSSGEHTSTGTTRLTAEVRSSEVALSDGYVALLMFQNDELTRRVEAIETKLSKYVGEQIADASGYNAGDVNEAEEFDDVDFDDVDVDERIPHGNPPERGNDLQNLFSLAMEDLINFQRQIDAQIKESMQRQDDELWKLADAVQKVSIEVNEIRSADLFKGALMDQAGDHVSGTADKTCGAHPNSSALATSLPGRYYRPFDVDSVEGTIDDCADLIARSARLLDILEPKPLEVRAEAIADRLQFQFAVGKSDSGLGTAAGCLVLYSGGLNIGTENDRMEHESLPPEETANTERVTIRAAVPTEARGGKEETMQTCGVETASRVGATSKETEATLVHHQDSDNLEDLLVDI